MAGRLFFIYCNLPLQDHEKNERTTHDNLLLLHNSIGFCPTIVMIKRDLMQYFHNRKKWTEWDDLNPRPPTFQKMPNFIIFVGIIHIIISLKVEPVSRLSNHGFSYFVFE